MPTMITEDGCDTDYTEGCGMKNTEPIQAATDSSQSLPNLELNDNREDNLNEGPSRSCRNLSRRSSHPATNLPLLNLSVLREHIPIGEDICTPRRNVEHIGRSLSLVKNYLYIGSKQSIRDASVIQACHITHIINLAGLVHHNQHSGVMYLSLSIRDDEREKIDDFFDVCIDFIEEARKRDGACVVICTQGISRSGAIAVAYLMSMECMNMEEALRKVRKCRPIVAPNSAFLNQLGAYERRLRAGRSETWVGRMCCVGSVDKILVARSVGEGDIDYFDDEVFIIEKNEMRGIVVWRGMRAAENVFKEAVRVANRMASRVRRECELRAVKSPVVAVQLCDGRRSAPQMEQALRSAVMRCSYRR